ncbi:MAG: cupin, partial [Imperialibacter sp.]
KFVMGALTLPLVPAFANGISNERSDRGFKIEKGEGRIHGHIQLKGVNVNILDVKVSGSDTNGELAIFEQTGLSQKRGTPMHVHHSQDEIFFVTEGV